MRGYFPTDVSNFTKEQCEEYLAAYPNSLKAESVRARLMTLSQSQQHNKEKESDDDYWNMHHNTVQELESYQNKYPQGKHIEECRSLLATLKSHDQKPSENKWVGYLIAILGIVFVIILVMTGEISIWWAIGGLLICLPSMFRHRNS